MPITRSHLYKDALSAAWYAIVALLVKVVLHQWFDGLRPLKAILSLVILGLLVRAIIKTRRATAADRADGDRRQ